MRVHEFRSTPSYTYDALYRLTGETRIGTGAYSQSYTYDLAGNMTQLNGSSFASYDSTNKISSITGGSVSYDSDGNTTAISGAGIPSTTLSWSTRNRLLRQQTSGDDQSYKYDASGKRVLKFPTGSSTTKTFYVFSGDTLIGEVSSGTPTYSYTWGAGGLVSQRDIGNSLSLWYHSGPQMETRQMTDPSGSVADSYRYDGYGRTLASSGTDFNPFKYGGGVGYYSDGSSGFMLATHRWYSPNLSRWMSRDPIGYGGSENLYRYVDNSPVLFLDPSGLISRTVRKIVDDALRRNHGNIKRALEDVISQRQLIWEAILEGRHPVLTQYYNKGGCGMKQDLLREIDDLVLADHYLFAIELEDVFPGLGLAGSLFYDPFKGVLNGVKDSLDPFYERPLTGEEIRNVPQSKPSIPSMLAGIDGSIESDE